eukprot:gene10209-2629_t
MSFDSGDVWSIIISFCDLYTINNVTQTSKEFKKLKKHIDWKSQNDFFFPELVMKQNDLSLELLFHSKFSYYKEKKELFLKEIRISEETVIKRFNSLIEEVIIPISQKKIIQQNDLDKTFPLKQISSILYIHQKNSIELNSNPKSIISCCNVFEQNLKEFQNSYFPYIYDHSICRDFREKIKNSKKFKNFLNQINFIDDIESILIVPLSRIPRYIFLFGNLLKYCVKPETKERVSGILKLLKELSTNFNDMHQQRNSV